LIFQETREVISKRLFLQQGAAAAAVIAAPRAFAQANYPDHPIRVLIPYPPGGSVDPIARVVMGKAGELMGQTMVMDNRAGGNTAIAGGMLVKSPADGYTLFFSAMSTHVIHTMQSNLPYDSIKDFTPIAAASRASYMIAIHKSVPATTLPEFIAYAKANPGKLNYASSGIGNANHLAPELFNLRCGTKITHVPYKGGGPALQDLLAGRVQMMFTNVPLVQPHVEAGTLRGLAYTSQLAGKPPVPLFSQYNMSEFNTIESLNACLGPANMPPAIVEKISAAIKQALELPEVKAAIANQQQDPFYMSPADLGARMRADKAKYTEVIEKAHIVLTG
jgi:tripartite-type tricarboxylate transporter receptor subunit TctC